MDPSDLFDVGEEPKKAKEGAAGWPPKHKEKTVVAPPPPPAVDGNVAAEFRTDLLSWLANGKQDLDLPRRPGLHASSLWKTCPRIPLLEKKYAAHIKVVKNTAGQQMTYDVGHALHDLIQNSYLGPFGRLWGKWKCLSCQKIVFEGTMPGECPECGVAWRDEEDGLRNIVYDELFVIDEKLDYCGHCDGLLLTRAGRKLIFEFKTISKSQYGGLKQPKHEHTIQCLSYMNALGLKDAIVLYWDKASQCDWKKLPDGTWSSKNPHLKVFHVKWDQGTWDSMVKRIKDYRRAEKRARNLPTVEIENINEFGRICTHKKCDMAGDCGVRDLCFAI